MQAFFGNERHLRSTLILPRLFGIATALLRRDASPHPVPLPRWRGDTICRLAQGVAPFLTRHSDLG